MAPEQIHLPIADGALAALDFGGPDPGSGSGSGTASGPPVLLVHGSGHNAAAWTDVAPHLAQHRRVVAVDLRGHGRTPLESDRAEQYWRDLAAATRALGWENPLLVGHSMGGYAVTAVTAAGLVDPAAVCIVDGLVLDDRRTAVTQQAYWSTPEALEQIRDRFGYGWSATEDEMRAYIDRSVREAPEDWLNAGSRPELVRDVLERSFTRRGDRWLRRPTAEQIAVISSPAPDADVYPSVDVYDLLTCPVTIVLPDEGFYADRRDEVRALVEGRPERALVEMHTHHNVPMAAPEELARIILATP
ncbi:alpha/beta hydrolase [Nocardiopsis sp. HNM0947]|uniref:Alpha/beta hydrolase n=1 Tax=Nocardiopsis coralli TaxID=2772213 RepID=A0ABR9PAE8_9ACTN|nr:alpha/beta hydrolase [Nocardiopsis coralli]MBE3000813.1 alpha/beta hydrolase [Nocardiopsis coralli]